MIYVELLNVKRPENKNESRNFMSISTHTRCIQY